MRNVLLTTTMLFGFGLAAGPALSQAQQPDASGADRPAACQPGDPNCPSGGTAGEAPGEQGGSGQAGDATQPATDSQAGDETRPGAESQAGDETRPETETQAGDDTRPGTESQAGDETRPETETQAGDDTRRESGNESQAEADGQDDETTASIPDVDVTVEQKTEIRQVISEIEVEPVEIDIDIQVGVEVPRTIEFHPLPPRIIEIVPEYRGYLFFVLADGRIVIVQPESYEVVVIIVV